MRIVPAKVVTSLALASAIFVVPFGKALLCIKVFVEPGSNKTLSKTQDFLHHVVSMTIIVTGVRLASLGFLPFGTGTI